jgi:hypothetical protein
MNVTLTRDATYINTLVAENAAKDGFVFMDGPVQCTYNESDSYCYLSANCKLRTPQGDDVTASLSDNEIRTLISERLTAAGYSWQSSEVCPNGTLDDGAITLNFVVKFNGVALLDSAFSTVLSVESVDQHIYPNC